MCGEPLEGYVISGRALGYGFEVKFLCGTFAFMAVFAVLKWSPQCSVSKSVS